MKFKAIFNKEELTKFNFILGMRFDGFAYNEIDLERKDDKMEIIVVYLRDDENIGYVSEVQETLMEELDSIQIIDYIGEGK